MFPLVACFLVGTCASRSTLPITPRPAPFSVAETAAVLLVRSGLTGDASAVIVIKNPDDILRRVTAALAPLRGSMASDSLLAVVSPAERLLAPGESGVFLLRAQNLPRVGDDVYTSLFTARLGSHRVSQLIVYHPARVQRLAETWTAEIHRGPFGNCSFRTRPEADVLETSAGASLSAESIALSDGGTEALRLQLARRGMRLGPDTVTFRVANCPPAGDYTGAIAIDSAQDLKLRARVTQPIWYALAAILIGLLAGSWLRQYFGAARRVFQLKREILKLRTASSSLNQNDYALAADDIQHRTDTLLARIDGFDWVALARDSETLVAEIKLELNRIAGAIETFRDLPFLLADHGEALRSAQLSVEGVDPPRLPEPFDRHTPAFTAPRPGIPPTGELTVTDLSDLGSRISERTVFLRRAREITLRFERDLAWWRAIERHSVALYRIPAQSDLGACLSAIHVAIWTLEEPMQLDELGLENRLRLVEQELGRVTYLLPEPAASTKLVAAAIETPAVAPQRAESVSAARSRRMLDRLSFLIEANDGGLLVLSFGMAAVVGLRAVYFGKPFGTVADYAAAVTWGFGARVGIDLLVAGGNAAAKALGSIGPAES
jgi:hypothetical protein